MKRLITIRADGVDLKVSIEGNAPCGLGRVLAREIRQVAFDFIADVTVNDEVWAEDVEK